MQIPDDRMDDFIARWKGAFGEHLSPDEARHIARQLIELYRELARAQRPTVRPILAASET